MVNRGGNSKRQITANMVKPQLSKRVKARRLRHGACLLLLWVCPYCLLAVATTQEDAVADVVATAFNKSRQEAHLSKLERMDRNPFREKVCKKDMRFSSGLIRDVLYETSDPAQLPEPAQKLAAQPDTSKTAARFGVGVCSLRTIPGGRTTYSVLIATYESHGTGFWRIFWD
jgi:hypothetical protein